MSDVKQVKVDNWGVYFLQRLKHFFNRTDYCDLTLQFQDNAQLKVHRLVLNSCTEYFEILERTCEMYSDCLIMPDDLQADVVVPIVNFMYTGQLEFKMDLLEKLYQTSLIMNMPVLTKLLEAHRSKQNLYGKRYTRTNEVKTVNSNTTPVMKKRTFSKTFSSDTPPEPVPKKKYASPSIDTVYNNGMFNSSTSFKAKEKSSNVVKDPKPTRYELPAELDDDNVFENSFTSLSYESKPLMVHPETTKHYAPKKSRIFDEPSSSKKFLSGTSTMDIVECRKITSSDIFEDVADSNLDDSDMMPVHNVSMERKDAGQLFDQILIKDSNSKITIEKKDHKETKHLDHAKIISEVLKKYPHLVKVNKNIKLKIMNSPNTQKRSEQKLVKPKTEPDCTYESDVVNSQEAARLISLGAENVKGPWICLICGTPGRALHFTSYYNYRRHLVDVHHEKPVSNMCEYCGLKSTKRNYLIYHLYTKHGVKPPRNYNFPKCNLCDYVALTDAFLIKHKMTHSDNRKFRCTVCQATFVSSSLLLHHIQKTGHKFSAEKKPNPQCIYCYKVFTRETNLYAHLKANHYDFAKRDGVIDDSDDECNKYEDLGQDESQQSFVEVEVPHSYDGQYEETSYNVEHKSDGNIIFKAKKITPPKKILNASFNSPQSANISQKIKLLQDVSTNSIESPKNVKKENIVVIDNQEYILPDPYETHTEEVMPTLTNSDIQIHNINPEQSEISLTKSNNLNQSIQIVVSNEEEYKALMNSNHSIIFDDGASDKALTVLGPAQNINVSDTINLNSASSSNEMMIIRENYPLHISESNEAENQNIVVVYSHPVDDANKHYQLISSSQALEGQFVQSSAIFTQNYETVTTSAALASGHIVVNHTAVNTDNSWQHDIPIVTSAMQVINPNIHQDTTVDALAQAEISQQSLEVHNNQQLQNIQDTTTSPNANNDQTMSTLTDVVANTFHNATIIPINEIPTISSINDEPMAVESFEEITCNNMESQDNAVTEESQIYDQPTPVTEDAEAIVEQSEPILQHSEMVEQQMPEQEQQQPLDVVQQADCEIIKSTENIQDQELSGEEHPTDVQNINLNIEHESQHTSEVPKDQIDISTKNLTEIVSFNKQGTENVAKHRTINSNEIEPQPDSIIANEPSPIQECNDNVVTEEEIESNIDQQPKVLVSEQQAFGDITTDLQSNPIPSTTNAPTEQNIQNISEEMEIIHSQVEKPEEESQTIISGTEDLNQKDDEESIENIARDIDIAVVPNNSCNKEISTDMDTNSTEKPVLLKEIANLTSEWSEEETDDAIVENQSNNESNENVISQEKSISTDEVKNVESKEKLSVLLNDWEDSQEEMPEKDTAQDEVIKTTDGTDEMTIENNDKISAIENKTSAPKEDNIRKLVSDWDEDEEEEIKN